MTSFIDWEILFLQSEAKFSLSKSKGKKNSIYFQRL